MRRTAVPRESVALIELSRIFAEGLLLGAIPAGVFETESAPEEQPARAMLVAVSTATTIALLCMWLNLPEPARDVILGSGVTG